MRLAIAGLINLMMELSMLAEKHSLEIRLGDSRKRKFLGENTGKTLGKKDLWDRLVEFLRKEQATRETFAFYEKIDKCRGMEPTSNRDSNKGGGQRVGNSVKANAMSSLGKARCYICDKDDHVISTIKGDTHMYSTLPARYLLGCLLRSE